MQRDSAGVERERGHGRLGLETDLLVVDGNPLQDVRVLQDHSRLKLIMKDGVAHRNMLGEALAARERRVA